MNAGVSAEKDWDMNSLCVPRVAKEAIGAICTLRKRDGACMTVNVEYNQLDPLLRSTVQKNGAPLPDPSSALPPTRGGASRIHPLTLCVCPPPPQWPQETLANGITIDNSAPDYQVQCCMQPSFCIFDVNSCEPNHSVPSKPTL